MGGNVLECPPLYFLSLTHVQATLGSFLCRAELSKAKQWNMEQVTENSIVIQLTIFVPSRLPLLLSAPQKFLHDGWKIQKEVKFTSKFPFAQETAVLKAVKGR